MEIVQVEGYYAIGMFSFYIMDYVYKDLRENNDQWHTEASFMFDYCLTENLNFIRRVYADCKV